MSPPTELVRMAKLEKSLVTSDEAHSGHATSVRPSDGDELLEAVRARAAGVLVDRHGEHPTRAVDVPHGDVLDSRHGAHSHLLSHHRPDRSIAFYRALGFEERRRLPIRDEAMNIYMGLPGDGDRLELTYNYGVEEYELGTAYGHIAITVDDIDGTLEQLAGQGIEPERPPYTVSEGVRASASCAIRTATGSS